MRLRRLGWAALAVGPTPAWAHSPVPGLEGFYIGILHPFSTPAQALMVVGAGLLIGGYAVREARWAFVALCAAIFGGIFFGAGALPVDTVLFGAAFVACALAALMPGRLIGVAVLSVAIGGWMIGALSVPDPGPLRDLLFTLSGSVVGANLGPLYIFGIRQAIQERFAQPWVAIAFRVAAAWLGAISLVMLALQMAAPPVA